MPLYAHLKPSLTALQIIAINLQHSPFCFQNLFLTKRKQITQMLASYSYERTYMIRHTNLPAVDVSIRSYFFLHLGYSFRFLLLKFITPEYCVSSNVLSRCFEKEVGLWVPDFAIFNPEAMSENQESSLQNIPKKHFGARCDILTWAHQKCALQRLTKSVKAHKTSTTLHGRAR